MTIEHVRPGDPLSARRWNEMVDRLNQSGEGAPPVMVSSEITISNYDANDIPMGTAVPIGWQMRHAALGPDKCRDLFHECGFQLEGSGGMTADFYAVTTEAIPADRVVDWRLKASGKALVPFRMVAAMVYATHNQRLYKAKVVPQLDAAENFFASASEGDYSIVAQSYPAAVDFGDYSYRRFCYLTLYNRLKVTYYDSSGTAHYDVPVSRLVFPNAFVGFPDSSDPSTITIRIRS